MTDLTDAKRAAAGASRSAGTALKQCPRRAAPACRGVAPRWPSGRGRRVPRALRHENRARPPLLLHDLGAFRVRGLETTNTHDCCPTSKSGFKGTSEAASKQTGAGTLCQIRGLGDVRGLAGTSTWWRGCPPIVRIAAGLREANLMRPSSHSHPPDVDSKGRDVFGTRFGACPITLNANWRRKTAH